MTQSVNEMIDFPSKWFKKAYGVLVDEPRTTPQLDLDLDLCLQLVYIFDIFNSFGHDFGRKRKWQGNLQLSCVKELYGIEGVKAAIMHHMLDYIDSLIYSDSENISMAAREVIGFAVSNLETILNDLRK